MNTFTKHDQEMLEIFLDPVKWAAHHLGEAPRWYQEQILRHPHHRKVLRCGRRIGKCIAYTERVLNPETGEYLTVEQLYLEQKDQNPKLITLNEKYQLEQSAAFFVEDNGLKPTFSVRTKYGAEVSLTGNHPVLTLNGWVEVDALRIGDRIATPRALPYFGKDTMSQAELTVIAGLLAGGHIAGNLISFNTKSEHVTEFFLSAVETLGGTHVKQLNTKNTHILRGEAIERLVQTHNLKEKKVPQAIFRLEREQIALFLKLLFSINGWASTGKRPEIGYATMSKPLTKDIKHLLLRFGINSNLSSKKNRDKGKKHRSSQLMIHRRDSLIAFLHAVGFMGKDDGAFGVLDQAMHMESFEFTVPKEVWPLIEEERKDKRLTKAQVAGSSEERLRTSVAPTLSKIATYADNMESAFLYDLARADLIWEEVVAIEALGEQRTFDVFVPETHNLVVEDIMVHNTWTMTAHMLWVAFTCNGGTETVKGATCVVATPYDNQARLIFDQLKTFIDNNPVLADSVLSMTKNPYNITFKNKSVIKLFTAGTRSGSEGGSLRGQKASWLYMDEVDYMSDKDFEAISAIALEAPKRIGIMVASTPTGKRAMFYKLCKELTFNQADVTKPGDDNWYRDTEYDRSTAEGWAEFYYPTMVNPEWDESMERELKGMYSNVAYEHEVLAEFGTEMVGVFDKDFVDEAASDGYALLSQPRIDSPVAIGIDWDKFGAATQIVVVQYDPYEQRRDLDTFGRFRVINRIEIPKGEFTYDNAVRKVIELDRIYNPKFIYPDRGAGEYQIEMLRKYLGDKVKGIHLGGSHEVRDPYSREFDKKPIKPFMVNQTTLLLERGMLRIPHKDIDEEIHRQMINYQVERIAPKTGEPTYTSDDEHALDAMMLALLAFVIEMPDIAQTIYEINVARTMGSANMRWKDPLDLLHKEHSNTGAELKKYVEAWDEITPPPPRKTNIGGKKKGATGFTWGSRGSSKNSFPSRRGW